MIDVRVAIEAPGWHRWPLAPEHRAYLRERHLHSFRFEVFIPVDDPDREIEFHDAREELERVVHDIAPICEFGDKSCEMLAQEVLKRMTMATEARVSEDPNHGAVVTRDDICTRKDNPVQIITVCGSTRFKEETEKALLELESRGIATFSVGGFMHADGLKFTSGQKAAFDVLHQDKIRVSHGIYVVNPDGYIGNSTANEIMLAWRLGKTVEWRYPRFGIQYGPLSAFYRRMERKLLLNARKGGWENMSLEEVLAKMKREILELEQALEYMRKNNSKTADDVADEFADVANFAMFGADIVFQPKAIL
jgi:hypothetical protein